MTARAAVRNVVVVLATALVALASPLPATAVDATCTPVVAAIAKMAETPVHSYSSESAPPNGPPGASPPRSSETISTKDAMYLFVKGRWIRSPLTRKEMKDEKDDSFKNTATCRHVRDELLEGDLAALYAIHEEIESVGTVDAQIWISITSGLPRKQEQTTDVGGALRKRTTVTRYEYSNVVPPAGVK